MIRGVVNARCEAVLKLRLRGPTGGESSIDAVVASGFTASPALPLAVISSLALARQSGGRAMLADGSVRQFDIFAADVEWSGEWRTVLVSAIGDEALVGMWLLRGFELRIGVVPGGTVEITPLTVP